MKKIEFIDVFQNWLKKNAGNSVSTLRLLESANLIDVNEIYQDEQVGVNESYYIINLPSELALTGVQQKFMYQTTELVFFDEEGDITAVKSIDYKLLNNR